MNLWKGDNPKYFMFITLKILEVITDYLNIVDKNNIGVN